MIDLRLRKSFGILLRFSPHHYTFSPKGVVRLSFTAHIERAPLPRARSASKKDGLLAPYPTLEKYEWDVSYTLACRRPRQERELPSRINPGSRREHGTWKRKLRTMSTS